MSVYSMLSFIKLGGGFYTTVKDCQPTLTVNFLLKLKEFLSS